jgi:hypothetical protein
MHTDRCFPVVLCYITSSKVAFRGQRYLYFFLHTTNLFLNQKSMVGLLPGNGIQSPNF